MGIGREYVEQKNTAIPSRTMVCTKNIYRLVIGGMKPVPARAIFTASPFRGHAAFRSIPYSLSIGKIIKYGKVDQV